ncbi:hypothetical protein PLICRDRAFT_44041 [Plicaturopsis crispa FD-325 SS-3]|nr:hypothetical protein PLICRDRAFT_44041 [Plicaturopsis crispa FD-325 SS-3]
MVLNKRSPGSSRTWWARWTRATGIDERRAGAYHSCGFIRELDASFDDVDDIAAQSWLVKRVMSMERRRTAVNQP